MLRLLLFSGCSFPPFLAWWGLRWGFNAGRTFWWGVAFLCRCRCRQRAWCMSCCLMRPRRRGSSSCRQCRHGCGRHWQCRRRWRWWRRHRRWHELVERWRSDVRAWKCVEVGEAAPRISIPCCLPHVSRLQLLLKSAADHSDRAVGTASMSNSLRNPGNSRQLIVSSIKINESCGGRRNG